MGFLLLQGRLPLQEAMTGILSGMYAVLAYTPVMLLNMLTVTSLPKYAGLTPPMDVIIENNGELDF